VEHEKVANGLCHTADCCWHFCHSVVPLLLTPGLLWLSLLLSLLLGCGCPANCISFTRRLTFVLLLLVSLLVLLPCRCQHLSFYLPGCRCCCHLLLCCCCPANLYLLVSPTAANTCLAMAVALAVLLWLSLWSPLLRGAAALHCPSPECRQPPLYVVAVELCHNCRCCCHCCCADAPVLLCLPLWPPLLQCCCFEAATAAAVPIAATATAAVLQLFSCMTGAATADRYCCWICCCAGTAVVLVLLLLATVVLPLLPLQPGQ
jgi:hypothetical protein